MIRRGSNTSGGGAITHNSRRLNADLFGLLDELAAFLLEALLPLESEGLCLGLEFGLLLALRLALLLLQVMLGGYTLAICQLFIWFISCAQWVSQ